jgi:hypothetical protein
VCLSRKKTCIYLKKSHLVSFNVQKKSSCVSAYVGLKFALSVSLLCLCHLRYLCLWFVASARQCIVSSDVCTMRVSLIISPMRPLPTLYATIIRVSAMLLVW